MTMPRQPTESWVKASRLLADIFDLTPRRVAAFWAIFAWSSVFAYWGHTPRQLERAAALIPTDWGIEAAWAIPAALLTIGAIPVQKRKVYRICRTLGASILAGVFMWWALEFFLYGGNRSWVSARSYLAFALLVLGCSLILGRARPIEREGRDV